MIVLCTLTCHLIGCRLRVVRDLHGLTYLIEVLDLAMREELERSSVLSDRQVDLCCEILKILFNITLPMDRNNLDEVRLSERCQVFCWDFEIKSSKPCDCCNFKTTNNIVFYNAVMHI
jgi:hypothetical protein